MLILQGEGMYRKHDQIHASDGDHARAQREQSAQQFLLAAGADDLDTPLWRPAPLPPSAADLVQFALWRSTGLGPEGLLSALALMPAARAELEGVETGLLFTARSAGLTWAQIADAMGFRSPQACQQHFNRLTARQGDRA